MTPKKLIARIKDPSVTLRERLFILTTLLAACGVLSVFVWNVIIGEALLKICCLGAAIAVVYTILALTVHFRKIQLGCILVACGTMFIVLPTEFFTGGGLYSCVPIWYVFLFLFIGLLIEKAAKYIMLALALISSVTIFVIAYNRPEFVTERSLDNTLIDLITSVITVGLMVYVMVSFQKRIYLSANKLVTEQKKEIEELNTAQSRFFSGMSHEIRTPINTIIGLNEMILREDMISDEVAENARSIQGASKLLLSLINDILDMSKIESGKMDIVPVNYNTGDMLSDVVNMIWARARAKDLEFHVNIDPSLPAKLCSDEVRIKQIMINLLGNAVKYTQEGSVTLTVQCVHRQGRDIDVLYSVRDTGMGIKKESLPYLFDAFKRVDQEQNRHIEGTGLGLSIVKQLTELMGGTISVNSIYTKGSEFSVVIPQTIADEQSLGSLDLETKRSMGDREHYRQKFEAPSASVLIVDDNESNLLVEKKLLRATKVMVDTVTSGQDCLARCLETHYDCIFMDHLMPGMDGIECLKALRTQAGGLNRQTPVVILTANAGGENRELYRKAGFDGYLLKPVTGDLLETMLYRHLPHELVTIIAEEHDEKEDESQVVMRRTEKVDILVTTDSVCDLPPGIVRNLGIPINPYRINTDKGVFLDGIEADTEGILGYMAASREHPSSEPPTVEDYQRFFALQLIGAHHVLHIAMASGSSLGYANAVEAASSFDNVTVIDSGHLSSGMGLIVQYAKRLAESGMDLQEVIKRVNEARFRTKTSFIVDSTDFLARSGRLGKRLNTLCSALMIHPVIVMKNNTMKVGRIVIGSNERMWRRYVLSVLSRSANADTSVIYLTYVGMETAQLDRIAALIRKFGFENIVYQNASPTISINCGPGCFGVIYMNREEAKKSE